MYKQAGGKSRNENYIKSKISKSQAEQTLLKLYATHKCLRHPSFKQMFNSVIPALMFKELSRVSVTVLTLIKSIVCSFQQNTDNSVLALS